jgi:diguanylate cyclase (GGDEF)-like protein/putative nucleotidyltransferase with HDIG domain
MVRPPPLVLTPATHSSRPPDPERRARILVVDDAGRLPGLLEPPLRDNGYDVVAHRTVSGLPALMDVVQPDLLLLDAGLPTFANFEVCGALRATDAGRQTPIMLLAGEAVDEEAIARGLLSGADDFCVVPGRLREFLARVRVQLRNKRDRDRLGRMRRERDSYMRAAASDALTGIPNRRSVEAAIQAAFATGARFAVLFVDVDHFKDVNDTLGHDGGDEVLKAVADCLQRAIRGSDSCGRYGGEEFVVVVADVDASVARAVAERHRRALEEMRVPVLGARGITVSLGVAVFEPDQPDQSATALVHRADTALYEAKRAGRNRVVVAPPEPPLPGALAARAPPATPGISRYEQALIDKLATGIAGLPLLPESAAEALRLAADAQTDVARIARLVDRDPPLAARVVAIAGSALYAGRAGRATTTQQALVRIGLAAARDLLYQVVYERSGSDLPRFQTEVMASFKRSVRAALAARSLTTELSVAFPYAYLAGLLHDIGEARVYRILAQLPGIPPGKAEAADLVARHHARAGAGIAQAWKLPSALVETCSLHHHDPTEVAPPVRLVMAADVLVRLASAAPALPEDDVARLIALGVRPHRVKPLVEALTSTIQLADPEPARIPTPIPAREASGH